MPKTPRSVFVKMILRYGFSFTAVKELIYLWLYYIVNHVVGVARVKRAGPGVRIRPTAQLREAQHITLGARTAVNHLCCLWAGETPQGSITCGKDVMFGPGVKIFGFNQGYAPGFPMLDQPYTEAPVVIGDDVWLGANVVITCGVTIGDGCVIAAGAVVTKDIPPYSIAAGVPARVIGSRAAKENRDA